MGVAFSQKNYYIKGVRDLWDKRDFRDKNNLTLHSPLTTIPAMFYGNPIPDKEFLDNASGIEKPFVYFYYFLFWAFISLFFIIPAFIAFSYSTTIPYGVPLFIAVCIAGIIRGIVKGLYS
jgi:hypothetical protein